MPADTIYLWKKVPVLRLLVPLVLGIILQWYCQLSLTLLIYIGLLSVVGIGIYSFLPLSKKWKLSPMNGGFISLLFVVAGAVLVYVNDVRHKQNWIGNKDANIVWITLQEPLVEKQNSYKAIASVKAYCFKNFLKEATGNIIIYFKKDSVARHLTYGSQIVFQRHLQLIKNSGNPGSFNYQQYSLFQGITHQVYLTANDFVLLPQQTSNAFYQFIFRCRNAVVNIFRKYIPGEKEQGLAEALFIGYKDDLDKNLVQSYTNTGVVHIIAISGLHLGLIYWLLLIVTRPLKRSRRLNLIRVLIIISSLWLFSILAGGQPSVLRSAVMFTFIALAEVFDRRTSVYNTLALSAFLLLCYNPFWLWDVGFQLSYAAIVSIIIFFRPVYNWLYFQNKALDFVWKLNAVTIAAQIFTLPISLYHFHQFPNLFLLTNMVAVPLSSIILMGEILLCVISFIPFIAKPVGNIVSFLIQLMNNYIERLNNISFATWNGINISILQTLLLIAAIVGISYWLLQKQKKALILSVIFFLLFIVLRSISFIEANRQQKLIVYNVPKHQAIDIINGRKYVFIGDSDLLYDDFARNFHLQPSRIMHRIQPITGITPTKSFQINQKQIAIIDSTVYFKSLVSKPVINLLVLSKNPKVYVTSLHDAFKIEQLVIDGSVLAWKAQLWKRECDSLHIPCYDVTEKGAFVMNL